MSSKVHLATCATWHAPLGLAAGMLGISGFESSAEFIEEQSPGAFWRAVRNLCLTVVVFNPPVSLVRGPVQVELVARGLDVCTNRFRHLTIQIKLGKTAEFSKVLSNDIVPIMREPPGFKHELAMVNGSCGVGLSVWQEEASAENYEATAYAEVIRKLSPPAGR